MAGKPWTEAEESLLKDLVLNSDKPNWSEWVQDYFLDRTADALRFKWEHLGETGELDSIEEPLQDYVPQFLDKKIVDIPDWRELIAHAEQRQSLTERASGIQRTAQIAVRGPFLDVYSSDAHLGSSACNYPVWRKHMDLVLDTEGVFLSLVGDMIENMRSFPVIAAVLSQALSPELQGLLLEGFTKELCDRNKILAMVDGNHEDFDLRSFGQTLAAYITRNASAPRFDNRAFLKLNVRFPNGKRRSWTNLLVHRSRYRSFKHALHGAKREYEMSLPADVVVLGHDHRAGMEYYDAYSAAQEFGMGIGGGTWLVSTPSYTASEWEWGKFGAAKMEPPVMSVLYTENGAHGFTDIDLAITCLKAEQAKYTA